MVGLRVDRVDYDEATAQILEAAREGRALRVAAANAHVVMEARDDPELARLLADFELITPDGQPLRWVLDATGPPLPDRVYGPELMRRVVQRAAQAALPIYLFGARDDVLERLTPALEAMAPGLEVAGRRAPGFGAALWATAEADVAQIRASGARIVFVGLGCPRQERWVGLHALAIGAPCLAVGAAFDLWAGDKPMAPPWMQRRGLEWLFRLLVEPRTRHRYLRHNPRFAVAALRQVAEARWNRNG